MSTKSTQSVARLDPDVLYRAKWTQAAREAYFKEHPENFAGPDLSYPIKDASDVNDAARLAGHAANPDAVKRKIIEIAKRLGLSDALPDSWKEDMKAKKKTPERAEQPDGRDAMEILDELTATSESGESEEEDGDPALQPDAARQDSAVIERAMPAPDVTYYAPIVRIDRETREIIGTATAERKDSYGTVIGYEASKDAFARWRGNIREMHDPKKAVGRALEIVPDDANRRIIVRARISKGAEDTWQKILDGTLTGFSIGGRNGKWTERIIDGEKVPYLERYDQAELSIVDNPACPGADIAIVRADGLASEVLAPESEVVVEPARSATQQPVERAGARLSQETREAMHMARDHARNALKQTCDTCGCDDCMDLANQLAANDDGDGDMDANFLAPASMRRLVADIVRTEISNALRDQVSPTMQRVNALLASDAQRSEEPASELTRRVDDLSEQIAAIKDLCEKIAAQPADGGPVLHGAAIDKRLATQYGTASRGLDDAEIMRRALELGFAPPADPNSQVRAAAAVLRGSR